ncbi:hypothetical protein FEM48_Zijuj01G0234300 [Ziziphus jujuba var. spinosa]|uniref:F-box domain-containing protein n=1 Tax=Ziziphus jujuba var. spinosa TaxID=714518 RepID=A0A978W463_ZIZJJ|nr:hypothetical protein FEM48_Zijuj01G0234300 [Ziziphus jujuba var. spinosa]
MENKKIRIHGDVDRIPKLPEETLHIILSKLFMEDASRFSAVSKIFLSAARSFPVLDSTMPYSPKNHQRRHDEDELCCCELVLAKCWGDYLAEAETGHFKDEDELCCELVLAKCWRITWQKLKRATVDEDELCCELVLAKCWRITWQKLKRATVDEDELCCELVLAKCWRITWQKLKRATVGDSITFTYRQPRMKKLFKFPLQTRTSFAVN